MDNKKVLLLGAGFTANFGAPVSSQIWNDLFNCISIQKNHKLRTILKKHQVKSDFEGFFEETIYDNVISVEEKKLVIDIILNVYYQINTHTSYVVENNSSGICLEKLALFLQRFSNIKDGVGYIFTLNQDIFLEKLINKYLRKNSNFVDYSVFYPGPINPPYIDDQWSTILPVQENLNEWLSKPNLGGTLNNKRIFPWYVKLHGSSGWKKNNEKLHIPVIGKNKSKIIYQQPLLNWYMELFKKNLHEQVDIWVIGYSFFDKHINEVLIQSLIEKNSSLYIINPMPLNDFIKKISSVDKIMVDAIDKKLAGYFPYYLNQLFSKNFNYPSYSSERLRKSLDKIEDIGSLNVFIDNDLST